MDHGGEAARPTTVGSAELGMANIGSGAFDAQLRAAPGSFSGLGLSGAPNNSTGFARQVRAAAGRGDIPVAALFHLHHVPGPGVVYANTGKFWRQPGPVGVELVGPRLPDGVVPVHDYYGYAALQPRQIAGRGLVLDDLLTTGGGAVYNGDYALQARRGAGQGEVFVGLLLAGGVDAVHHNTAEFARHVRTDPGRGEVPVAEFWRQPGPVHVVLAAPQLPDALVPVHDNNYGYSALPPRPGGERGVVLANLLTGGGGGAVYNGDYALVQPRRGARHGEVLVDLLPDGAGHGEVFVEPLLGGDVAADDHYGYYAWQPRPGAGRGEVFPGGGVGGVFVNSGNFTQQTPPGIGHADEIGMVTEHLRRFLPFAGIGLRGCEWARRRPRLAGSCVSPLRAAFGRPASDYPARAPCVGFVG